MALFDEAVILDGGRVYPWAPRRQLFTPAEDRAIVWAYRRGWTLARIADQSSRNVSTMQQRVSRLIAQGALSRRPPLPGRRPWTVADVRYLHVHWGLLADAEVAAHLGRTVDACEIRATRVLHQARRDAFLSAGAVARLLDVNEKTVVGWAQRDWLAITRSPIHCGGVAPAWSNGPRRCWSVSPRALRRFFRERPWAIPPLAGMPEPGHWLAEAARQAWGADPWLTVAEVAAQVHYCAARVRDWIVRDQLAQHERRTKYGQKGGPWQGAVVIRQSDMARLVARHAALEDWRRHSAAVRRCAAEKARR